MGKNKKKKKKKPQDPLSSTMSLGDHLDELRGRLVLAITGLLIGTGICLLFGTRIIKFIERPYTKVFQVSDKNPQNEDERLKLIQDLFGNARRKLTADPNTQDIDPKTEEFVQKFCTEAILALFNDPNYTAIRPPGNQISPSTRLQILSPAAGFISYIKIALMAGLILSSPWVFYHIWMFVAAGLYANEKKYVHTAVPFSATLFVTGALFFLFVVAPLTLGFLVKFNEGVLDARSNFTFADYISFITMLMLVFGAAFQTPVAIFFLNRTGLVSIHSQVTLAIPLYLLFEMGILLSMFAERRRKSQEKAA